MHSFTLDALVSTAKELLVFDKPVIINANSLQNHCNCGLTDQYPETAAFLTLADRLCCRGRHELNIGILLETRPACGYPAEKFRKTLPFVCRFTPRIVALAPQLKQVGGEGGLM